MPTPGAVGEIIKRIANKEQISVVGVDIEVQLQMFFQFLKINLIEL